MKRYFSLDNLAMILVILVIAFVVGALIYNLYGHLTQRETVTIQVTDKFHYTTNSTSCSGEGSDRSCSTTTYHHYRVVSPGEEFSISRGNYGYILVGKKHVVYVTGWKGSRNIAQVLE